MLPNHGRPRHNSSASELWRRHERTVAPHLVPKTLDWRGTGADSPVKDQAMCGGCWVRSLRWQLKLHASAEAWTGMACTERCREAIA